MTNGVKQMQLCVHQYYFLYLVYNYDGYFKNSKDLILKGKYTSKVV